MIKNPEDGQCKWCGVHFIGLEFHEKRCTERPTVDRDVIKVLTWRILSITICTITGRLWFGDWHVTSYGLCLAVGMTGVHWLFEKLWREKQ